MRYIDADALKRAFWEFQMPDPNAEILIRRSTVIKTIDEQPTADVVEVVRCKDCKNGEFKSYAPPSCRYYCKNSTNYHSKDFYCSMGER